MTYNLRVQGNECGLRDIKQMYTHFNKNKESMKLKLWIRIDNKPEDNVLFNNKLQTR